MSKELEAFARLEQSSKRYKGRKKDLDTIFTALKEKEKRNNVLKILKEVIAFGRTLPQIEPNKDNDFNVVQAVVINIQRDIENRERELLRQWVLETCFPKELKALEIIKKKTELNYLFGNNEYLFFEINNKDKNYEFLKEELK